MRYFYYSPKQANSYRQENKNGGRYDFLNKKRTIWKVNYVFNGDAMIAFTEQGIIPPDKMKGWDDYQLVFQSESPKTIHSQEPW